MIKDRNNFPQLIAALKAGRKAALEKGGQKMKEALQSTLRKGQAGGPPLTGLTSSLKGSSTKLLESEAMAEKIRVKFVKENEVVVGWPRGLESIKARVHEYGMEKPMSDPQRRLLHLMVKEAGVASTEGTGVLRVPARPFIRPTFDANIEKIQNEMDMELFNIIARFL